jgi:hypothetical protein
MESVYRRESHDRIESDSQMRLPNQVQIMTKDEERGLAACRAFAAVAMLADRLNKALNQGQRFDMSVTQDESGGCQFIVKVHALAAGEEPHYEPCGHI